MIDLQSSSGDPEVLFVTRFDASSRSAIGVQTRQFLRAVPRSIHLYWDQRTWRGETVGSSRIENYFVARPAAMKRSGSLKRIAQRLGLSWWTGQDFSTSAAARISLLCRNVRAAYFAPIGGDDAPRMRRIAELLQRPFVVHLWDILDDEMQRNEDFAWLMSRAKHVYCLTPELITATGRPDAELLLFTRPHSTERAFPPGPGGRFRIALLGDVLSYLAGVDLLAEACRLSELPVDVVYIGPTSIARRLPERLRERLLPTGFLKSDSARDAFLASCHAGFLPGPRSGPERDQRSRYSVPSRILDFMAVGLPIVGCAHPSSATRHFAAMYNVDHAISCQSASDLSQQFGALWEPEQWAKAQQASLQAFNRIKNTDPAAQLALILSDTCSQVRVQI